MVPACQVPAVIIPAAVKSKLAVSMTRFPEPPPINVVPVELPVLIWVSKLEVWLREMGAPELDSPAKAARPAELTFPPAATSKLVKSIREVAAVVPEISVSQPDPKDMALEVDPPVADEIESPVPEVTPVPDRLSRVPEEAELAVMVRRPVPV